jgi:hypothetical protein
MTYENFLKVILQQQKSDRVISEAYKLNIDLLEFVDPYHHIISTLIKEIYGEEGYDWYSWFCYENDYGQKDWSSSPCYRKNHKGEMELIHEAGEVRFGAHDEDGTPICYSHESLWGYLEINHLINNKEKTDVMKETKEEFISLYDYVGHKDEKGIGENLYNFAISCGVKPLSRQVENPKYKGKVMTYPRSVIKSFFELSSLNK